MDSKEDEKILKIMYLRVPVEDLGDEWFEEVVLWLSDEVVASLMMVVMVDHHHLGNRKSINTFEKFLQEVLEKVLLNYLSYFKFKRADF